MDCMDRSWGRHGDQQDILVSDQLLRQRQQPPAIEGTERREVHQQCSGPSSLWLVNVGFVVGPLVRLKLQACWTAREMFSTHIQTLCNRLCVSN